MYEYVYVVVCLNLVKKLQLFNSVCSKYYILHLFKLFTMTCFVQYLWETDSYKSLTFF